MVAWIVVEDEPDLYDMVLAMYDTMGIDGVAFSSGEDAVDWINAVDGGYGSEIPEVALIDIRLPGAVNGVEVSARLRQSVSLGSMVIVLMTAYRLSPQEEAATKRQARADLVMYKPLPLFTEFQRRLETVGVRL